MALPNFSSSHWQSITLPASITVSRWNSFVSDIKTTLSSVNYSSLASGSGLNAFDVDGVAVTRASSNVVWDAAEQGVTRDTKANGLIKIHGPRAMRECTVTLTIVTSWFHVGGLNTVVLDLPAGIKTIRRLTGGVAGQRIRFIIAPGQSGTICFGHSVVGSGMILDAAATLTCLPQSRGNSVEFIFTNLNSFYTNNVWIELGRRSLA